MKYIPFLKPYLVKKETYLKYLSQIDEVRYYSNFGRLNSLFEKKVLEIYFSNQGAVTTVNNATTALMIALSMAKRPGAKYALMPSFTFAATPLAAMWCGLKPYFVDICEDTWCMDKELLKIAIRKLEDDVAVVVPYAAFGTCIDLTYYNHLQKTGIPIVVDAAPAFGTTGDDGQLGKNFYGSIVFSLHATKPFGIGEGALIYSKQVKLIACIRQCMNFGFTTSRECEFQGLNGKLSEYAAAVALATLEEFPKKIEQRQLLSKIYFQHLTYEGLLDKGWVIQKISGKVPLQFISALCPHGITNADVVRYLSNHFIESRTYFSPACHQQQAFLDYPRTSMAVTERLSQRIVSLPLWEDMPVEDIARVVRTLREMEG